MLRTNLTRVIELDKEIKDLEDLITLTNTCYATIGATIHFQKGSEGVDSSVALTGEEMIEVLNKVTKRNIAKLNQLKDELWSL